MSLFRTLSPKQVGVIQTEHSEWSEQNFGAHTSFVPLLGMMEECGELMHAELKARQGIRGTRDEHEAASKDALADIMIYLCDYATCGGGSLSSVVANLPVAFEVENEDNALVAIGKALSVIWNQYPVVNSRIGELADACDKFATIRGWSLQQILAETWSEVKKRNWKKYPRTGFPEELASNIDKERTDRFNAIHQHVGELFAHDIELFAECDTCRANTGSPELCGGCARNRATIISLSHPWVEASMPVDLSKSAEALDAVGILKAVITIQEERGRLYGDGKTRERNMGHIVRAFNEITGISMTATQGYLFMVALKAVRAGHGGGVDAYADGASYFALAGEELGVSKARS